MFNEVKRAAEEYCEIAAEQIIKDGGKLKDIHIHNNWKGIQIRSNSKGWTVDIPNWSFLIWNEDAFAALKILLGHELCHEAFNLQLPYRTRYAKGKSEEANRGLLLHDIMIECACDAYGGMLFSELGNNIPAESIDCLIKILGQNDSIHKCFKYGYLFAAQRADLIGESAGHKMKVSSIGNKYSNAWDRHIGLGYVNRKEIFKFMMNHPMQAKLDRFLDFDVNFID